MTDTRPAITVQHQATQQRFLAVVEGRDCVLDYQREGQRVSFTHTGVPPQLEGRGIAAALVKTGLAWARAEGLQVQPACSYVRAYMQRHPEVQDLTASQNAQPSGQAQAVLDFWFGAAGSAEAGQVRSLWFTKSEATDREIAERFAPLVRQGLQGDLQVWAARPDTALAQIIVLDQFTRNLYRNSAQAFAGDASALRTAAALVDSGQDLTLTPLQRWFVYMPFEHDEHLENQDRAVRLFEVLLRDDPRLGGALDYARRHRAVIQRFGRFPHRNVVLGRESTPEELAYLAEPGAGF